MRDIAEIEHNGRTVKEILVADGHTDLRDADLSDADLRYADLRDADLRYADLRHAYLRHANLSDADLRDADLSDADLRHANLSDADLSHADLPPTEITPQEGSFIAWKSARGATVKLKIPEDADRQSCYTSRKCRAEYVEVLAVEYDYGFEPPAEGHHDRSTTYAEGETVHADKFDDDRRVECSNGIHFFMTEEEAENW